MELRASLSAAANARTVSQAPWHWKLPDGRAILRAFKAQFLEVFMKLRPAALLVLIAASGFAIRVGAQQPSSSAAQGAASPYVKADQRPQGWAVRDYLHNTLGWPTNKPLWNKAKQK